MNFLRPYLDQYAATLDRFDPSARIHTVGASDVGQCERKVYWTKNLGDPDYGAPVDPEYVDSYGAKLRGSMFENQFWAPGLKAMFGDRFKFAGEDQQTFALGNLSATPDGLLTELTDEERAAIAPNCGTEVMCECKTFDPRTNLADPKAENVFQTQVQMGLVRELTPYKPTHSILSYTDASWWGDGKEFVIEFDPQIFENAKARANRIMFAKSVDELDPEGWIGGGRDCEYCPFTNACGVVRRRVPDGELLKGMDPQFVEEVSQLARAVKQFEPIIDEASENKNRAIEALKSRLREKGVRKVPGVVSWSSIKGRAGWNNKAIREAAEAAGIDLTEFATEGEPSDRLQVTLKS